MREREREREGGEERERGRKRETSISPVAIGNFVWDDTNGDGVQSPSEQGLSGVVVTLESCANTTIGITTTNTNGTYQFSSVAPGCYQVVFSNLPAGYVSTLASIRLAGTDSEVKGGMNWSTGNLILGLGITDENVDAGFVESTGRFFTRCLAMSLLFA